VLTATMPVNKVRRQIDARRTFDLPSCLGQRAGDNGRMRAPRATTSRPTKKSAEVDLFRLSLEAEPRGFYFSSA
jgi:hypothetical protein